MSTHGRLAAVLFWCAAVLTGCGGPSPASPTPASQTTLQNVAGTWTGRVGGVSQGVTLDGTMTLTLQQSLGVLSGRYDVAGTLTNPTQVAQLRGSVTLTGTVASGPNPAVSFTTTSVQCPSLPSETWSGSYASGTGVLTIAGTAHVLDERCTIVLRYRETILLNR